MKLRSIAGSMLLLGLCVLQACAGNAPRAGSGEEIVQANLNLGVAYLRQGRAELALEKLQRALEEDSRNAVVHSTIAIAYDRLGQPEEAERHYRRATQLDPGNPASANSYAVFLCRQNRWSDAEPYFERAVNNPRYSTPAAALTNAGLCAQSAGDPDRAEEFFRAALEQDPDFADALSGMMEVAYRQQNYLQARAFMQRYTDIRTPNASILWLCVVIEQELDNAAAARRCADQLRERFPESEELARLQQSERDAR